MSHQVRVISCIVMSAAVLALGGCTSEVNGRVVSASTGSPIAGAEVTISDVTTSTDQGGSFVLSKLKRGQLSGHVKVAGYQDAPFSINAQQGVASAVVEIPDSTLKVVLSENAIEPVAVEDFEIALDGFEPTSTIELGPLSPGDHRLVVRSKGREDFETTLTLAPGSNVGTAALSLTPLETYKRFFKAGRYHRDSVAYKYIHPHERKRLSLKKWKAWGDGQEDKSIKFGDVRMLRKWKSKYVKKTYKNVAEVDRTIVYQVSDSKYSDFGKTYTDNFNQHWVKADGRWYVVHASGPK